MKRPSPVNGASQKHAEYRGVRRNYIRICADTVARAAAGYGRRGLED